MRDAIASLEEKKVYFWDFDGVIKESHIVKDHCYLTLFKDLPNEAIRYVENHHRLNPGMSRFEKIPHYLEVLKHSNDPYLVQEYLDRFASCTKQMVIDSNYVGGVIDFIKKNQANKFHYVITATPESEMIEICDALGIGGLFVDVKGSPKTKPEHLRQILTINRPCLGECLFIGDSPSDEKAARAVGIDFLLRRHSENEQAFAEFQGDWFEFL